MDDTDFGSLVGRIFPEPPAIPSFADVAAPPATLDDDPGVAHIMGVLDRQADFMESQLRSFERYVEESRESARMAWRWSLASLVVAALSLLVALVSLLGQFGVIG